MAFTSANFVSNYPLLITSGSPEGSNFLDNFSFFSELTFTLSFNRFKLMF